MTRTNHDEKCGHETSLAIREALLLKQEKDASVPSFVLHGSGATIAPAGPLVSSTRFGNWVTAPVAQTVGSAVQY